MKMKKTIFLTMILFLSVGCSSKVDKVRTINRKNLLKLSVGMEKAQALKVMGKARAGGGNGEPTINSPYKSEILQGENKTFEVVYYYTDIKNTLYSTVVTVNNKELTPLVFDQGRLIGWGWQFLKVNMKKYGVNSE